MGEFAKRISCEVLVKHIEIRESAHTVGSAGNCLRFGNILLPIKIVKN